MNAIMQRLDSLLQGYEQVATNEARKLRKDIQTYFESTGLLPNQKQAQQIQAPQPAPPTAQPVVEQPALPV
jgi:ElaB/YqjD/DUF883 family membrane-anchored ribosome-binding protein